MMTTTSGDKILYIVTLQNLVYIMWWAILPSELSMSSLFMNRKKYTTGPRYWNIPVLVNTRPFLVYQYCLKMWYLHSSERAGIIQKFAILECKNGLVLSNTRVPVSGTWDILFPMNKKKSSDGRWTVSIMKASWISRGRPTWEGKKHNLFHSECYL